MANTDLDAPLAFDPRDLPPQPTPEENEQAALQQRYGSFSQGLAASLEGAAETATFGLSPLAEQWAGVPKEDILGRERANPWWHGAGSLAGVAVPAALTAGAGLLGTGAKTAAKVGAEYAAPSIYSAVGRAAGEATERALASPEALAKAAELGTSVSNVGRLAKASRTVADVERLGAPASFAGDLAAPLTGVRRLAPGAVRAGVEGIGYGLGQVVKEETLGQDPSLNAIALTVGTSGLLGGVLGATGEGASMALANTQRAFRKSWVAPWLRDAEEATYAKRIGMKEPLAPGTLAAMSREGLFTEGTQPKAMIQRAQTVASEVSAARDNILAQAGDVRIPAKQWDRFVDETIDSIPTTQRPKGAEWAKGVDVLPDQPAIDRARAALTGVGDESGVPAAAALRAVRAIEADAPGATASINEHIADVLAKPELPGKFARQWEALDYRDDLASKALTVANSVIEHGTTKHAENIAWQLAPWLVGMSHLHGGIGLYVARQLMKRYGDQAGGIAIRAIRRALGDTLPDLSDRLAMMPAAGVSAAPVIPPVAGPAIPAPIPVRGQTPTPAPSEPVAPTPDGQFAFPTSSMPSLQPQGPKWRTPSTDLPPSTFTPAPEAPPTVTAPVVPAPSPVAQLPAPPQTAPAGSKVPPVESFLPSAPREAAVAELASAEADLRAAQAKAAEPKPPPVPTKAWHPDNKAPLTAYDAETQHEAYRARAVALKADVIGDIIHQSTLGKTPKAIGKMIAARLPASEADDPEAFVQKVQLAIGVPTKSKSKVAGVTSPFEQWVERVRASQRPAAPVESEIAARAKAYVEKLKEGRNEAAQRIELKGAQTEWANERATMDDPDRKVTGGERVLDLSVPSLADIPAGAFNKAKSQSLAEAYATGKEGAIPPIDLRNMREVENGAHRLSVARAVGAPTIKARVGPDISAEEIAPYLAGETPELAAARERVAKAKAAVDAHSLPATMHDYLPKPSERAALTRGMLPSGRPETPSTPFTAASGYSPLTDLDLQMQHNPPTDLMRQKIQQAAAMEPAPDNPLSAAMNGDTTAKVAVAAKIDALHEKATEAVKNMVGDGPPVPRERKVENEPALVKEQIAQFNALARNPAQTGPQIQNATGDLLDTLPQTSMATTQQITHVVTQLAAEAPQPPVTGGFMSPPGAIPESALRDFALKVEIARDPMAYVAQYPDRVLGIYPALRGMLQRIALEHLDGKPPESYAARQKLAVIFDQPMELPSTGSQNQMLMQSQMPPPNRGRGKSGGNRTRQQTRAGSRSLRSMGERAALDLPVPQ